MNELPLDAQLNRAGRRAEEKRARRKRAAGAALAAGAATFGTTAGVLGVGVAPAGAVEQQVTNCNPTGAGSLHDVAEAAGDGDVIVFNTGGCNVINLDDEINVDTSITIQGPGSDAFTVTGDTGGDGSNDVRIFNVAIGGTGSFTISGLTLSGGLANAASVGGGAILNDNENLSITNVVFDDNLTDASGLGEGGGAIKSGGGSMTIASSTFHNNESHNDGGGAIMFRPGVDLTITNSTFDSNEANGGGGALYIRNLTGAVMISGSTFTDNYADGSGAGGYIEGIAGDVTVTGSTFTGNYARDYGGALEIYDTGAVSITDTTMSGNFAYEGGGGARIYQSSSVDILNTTISGNHVKGEGEGGGLFLYEIQGNANITNSTIDGNDAQYEGGGLFAYDIQGDLNISNTAITNNTAGDSDHTGYGGGGAFIYGVSGNVNITNSNISGNETFGYGGGLYVAHVAGTTSITFSTIANNTAAYSGGGIELFRTYDVFIGSSTISGNRTGVNGGGIYISDENYGGVTIANSTISGNVAAVAGGAILFASYYALDIIQSTITLNEASTVGGIEIPSLDQAAAQSKHEANAQAKAAKVHTKDATKNDGEAAAKAGKVKTKAARGGKVHAAEFGDLQLWGSIVQGNQNIDIGEDGAVTARDSLLGVITGTAYIDQGGNLLGVDPRLGPLDNNGGPTRTHALLLGSPAINAGGAFPSFPNDQDDQRGPGFPRIVGGVVDIGAYEVQPSTITPTFTG